MWWTGVVRHAAGVSSDRAAAPSGVVTFLAARDEGLRQAIEARSGFMFKHTGDGVSAAFASPKCAP
jgi:class 3 adenylate cyclase